MQSIRRGTHLGPIEQLWQIQRRERAERITKFGFAPDCNCTWCGGSGINREEGSICHCESGDEKAKSITRISSWPHLVPTLFENYTLESCPNGKLAADVSAWLAGDPVSTGQNLVIQGRVGVGKTGAAIGALRELHMAGHSVAYWSLPDLMDIFRSEERSAITGRDFTEGRKVPMMEHLRRVGCVLLDDLGQERVTDYVAERLYVLIDGRYSARKPTILTTNLAGQDLEQHIGERNASRLRENYISVRALGHDLRRRS
jgi:DNA replication protein DnaC